MVAMLLSVLMSACLSAVAASNILMITLGGTRSHKVPFLALGQGLVSRSHNITLLSAFPPGPLHHLEPAPGPGALQEVAPAALVEAVEAFSHMDVLAHKLKGQSAYSVTDVLNYTYKICKVFYSLTETRHLLSTKVDLLILDGAFPECLLALSVHFNCPFILLNTVAFHTLQMSVGGNPVLPSVTPFFDSPYSDRMDLWERTANGLYHVGAHVFATILNKVFMEPVVRRHLGPHVPPNSMIGLNVSLILQNGHHTITYPRPFLPGVVEVACIHCSNPRPLDKDLEEFVRGGQGKGFVYISFGTSLRSTQVPGQLRSLMVRVFGSLPYQVLWKHEAQNQTAMQLPANVRVNSWFPQQDLLGHPMIKGFINHGGLHGVMEAVYHRVPMVLLPIFCDHAANSRKARDDGYAEVLEWRGITEDLLRTTIIRVTTDKRYKAAASRRSELLRDQPQPPLQSALYWVQYVLRHGGAPHLHSAARDLSTAQYYMLDSLALLVLTLYAAVRILKTIVTLVWRRRWIIKIKTN